MTSKQEDTLRAVISKTFVESKPSWLKASQGMHSNGEGVDFLDVLFTDDCRSVPHYLIESNEGFEKRDKFGQDGSKERPWVLSLTGFVIGLKRYVQERKQTIEDELKDPSEEVANWIADEILQYALFDGVIY